MEILFEELLGEFGEWIFNGIFRLLRLPFRLIRRILRALTELTVMMLSGFIKRICRRKGNDEL